MLLSTEARLTKQLLLLESLNLLYFTLEVEIKLTIFGMLSLN